MQPSEKKYKLIVVQEYYVNSKEAYAHALATIVKERANLKGYESPAAARRRFNSTGKLFLNEAETNLTRKSRVERIETLYLDKRNADPTKYF